MRLGAVFPILAFLLLASGEGYIQDWDPTAGAWIAGCIRESKHSSCGDGDLGEPDSDGGGRTIADKLIGEGMSQNEIDTLPPKTFLAMTRIVREEVAKATSGCQHKVALHKKKVMKGRLEKHYQMADRVISSLDARGDMSSSYLWTRLWKMSFDRELRSYSHICPDKKNKKKKAAMHKCLATKKRLLRMHGACAKSLKWDKPGGCCMVHGHANSPCSGHLDTWADLWTGPSAWALNSCMMTGKASTSPSTVKYLKLKHNRRLLMMDRTVGDSSGEKAPFVVMPITGKNERGTRCQMAFYIRMLTCKTCACREGLLKHFTSSENLSSQPTCEKWFMRATSAAQLFFSDIRSRVMEELAKKCSGYKCTTVNPEYSHCKASSVAYGNAIGHSHGTGRLNSNQGWSAGQNQAGQWWQMDLGHAQLVTGIVTQGRRGHGEQYVKSYNVQTSQDSVNWSDVDGGKNFTADAAAHNVTVERTFASPVRARFVRIVVQTWKGRITMRAAALVCGIKGQPTDLRESWGFMKKLKNKAVNKFQKWKKKVRNKFQKWKKKARNKFRNKFQKWKKKARNKLEKLRQKAARGLNSLAKRLGHKHWTEMMPPFPTPQEVKSGDYVCPFNPKWYLVDGSLRALQNETAGPKWAPASPKG